MKHIIISLAWLSSSFLLSAQQNAQTDVIASMGEVWGFLKYFHPNIADGSQDWDSVLVHDLPSLIENPQASQLQLIVQKWLEEAGTVNPCKTCLKVKGDTSLRNLDLAFLEEASPLNNELKAQLQYIRDNRYQGNSYYAQVGSWNGPVSFENETPYIEELYPSQPVRILALFRYWNAIQYYFPYKYLIGEDWRATLREYVPLILEAEDQLSYHLVMRKLTNRIYDSHSYFNSSTWNQSHGSFRLLASVKLIEDKTVVKKVIPDSNGVSYPLEIGDVVLAVGGVSVDTLRERLASYMISSNEVTTQRKVSNWLLLGSDEMIDIEIERNGQNINYQLKGVDITAFHKIAALSKPSEGVPKWEKRADNIGYVDMGRLVREEVEDMMSELMDCKAIIFDVRNYPQSTYRKVANYLCPTRSPFATFTYPDPNYPGRWLWYKNPYLVGKYKNKDYYKGQVIVLQDESTQSHAEFSIMSMQTAPNCTVIGSQTAGADGNVTKLKLPGGISVFFTGIGVYYPDKGETQRIGIEPDIEIKPTLEGFRNGRDEVLERAILFVEEGKI